MNDKLKIKCHKNILFVIILFSIFPFPQIFALNEGLKNEINSTVLSNHGDNKGNITIQNSPSFGMNINTTNVNHTNLIGIQNQLFNIQNFLTSNATEHNDKNDRCDLNNLSNVPQLVEDVQERKKVIDDINQVSAKNDKGLSLVCIYGFSGSGKTLLATKYALDHEKDYHHTRFFDANDINKLLDGFISIARSLCHDELDLCFDRSGNERENCVIDIVKRCIKGTQRKFLWIFDDVKRYEDIKKYIPNEQYVKGIILITTQEKEECIGCKQFIDLSDGMTEEESCSLLKNVIQKSTQSLDINHFCNNAQISKIAINILDKIPISIRYTGELIGELGSCGDYINLYATNPLKTQDESLAESIQRYISSLDPLNLDIAGLLSFTRIPLSLNLITAYINANDEYRTNIGLTGMNLIDKIKIARRIKNNLVKKSNNELLFSHELFRKQMQRFLIEKDKEKPGSYKKVFDRLTELLFTKLPDYNWDDSIWSNDENKLLLRMGVALVSDDISDPESYNTEVQEKLHEFNDCQLSLLHQIAKCHIKTDPFFAIKLFNKLLKRIESNHQIRNNSSKYLDGSIETAEALYGLAIASCQALYMENSNSEIDLDKAEISAKSAYKIFEKELGKENPKTLNTFLIFAHINATLKKGVPPEKAYLNKIEFTAGEPTIDAALELANLSPDSEEFKNLKNELSGAKKSLNNEWYSSIYGNVSKKLEERNKFNDS